MKKTILFLVLYTFIIFSTFAQYEKISKPEDIDYKDLDQQIGKEYWIKSNPNAINRKKFREILRGYGDEFVVKEDVRFTIIGWELGSYNLPSLKLEFEDGKIAYINVLSWRLNKDVLSDVFDGSDYNDNVEYFFKGRPNDELAKWKKIKLQEQAKQKAKGGVRIGMSKEQVLKSNWGKPEEVYKTTNSSSVREQWVYGGRNYLYFTNGILTSIQN